MKKQFALCGKADDIILFQSVVLKEHLVIIVAPVHDKGGFGKKSRATFHGRKGYIINGSKVPLIRGMELREDTDRMAVFCQDTGFDHMIALYIDIFGVSAF